MTFTLRYPRENDPHYLLTHPSWGAWRFEKRDAALGAYNAGLAYESLLHRYEHPDEYGQRGKRHDNPDAPEIELDRALRGFERACVDVRQRGKKSQTDQRSAETA